MSDKPVIVIVADSAYGPFSGHVNELLPFLSDKHPGYACKVHYLQPLNRVYLKDFETDHIKGPMHIAEAMKLITGSPGQFKLVYIP